MKCMYLSQNCKSDTCSNPSHTYVLGRGLASFPDQPYQMDTQRIRLNSLRALVLVEVGSDVARELVWRARTTLPTIDDLQIIRPLLERQALDVDRFLACDDRLMALEEAEGNWETAIGDLTAGVAEHETVDDLSRMFREHVRPLERARKTRRKHSTSWNSVVTWAIARGALPNILPMSDSTLEALLWDALSLGSSLPVLKGLINSIKAHHRQYKLVPPLSGNGDYRRMTKTLSRFQGTQHRHVFPIHRDAVVSLLLLPLPDHEQGRCSGPSNGCKTCIRFVHRWRDVLCGAVHTIGCMRPDEGACGQICDWWMDYDVAAGYSEFAGSAALNIPRQKNDAVRRGHQKRFGRSEDPELDIVDQMNQFHLAIGLKPSSSCSKRSNPNRRCKDCPPLFPLSHSNKRDFILHKAPSSNAVADMIVRGLRHIGLDTTLFSAVCARRGGLSTAIEAGVPEAILWMQSGHAQEVAARRYVQLRSPKLLYATWEAFKL